jgi:hypothetical protein
LYLIINKKMENDNVKQMHEMVLEVMKKYTFIEEYLSKPDVNTGNKMPLLVKFITTILYLRRRLEFQVDADETFYDSIERNDYSYFEDISDKVELYKILVCFVTMACSYIDAKVSTDDGTREKIIATLRQYYYKNKGFVE